MPSPDFCVCVFCASSESAAPAYRQVATDLGTAIAQQGWQLVYGGGNLGLMGDVARAALAGGAVVTGVIPHRLADRELALEELAQLIRTDTMRQRKALMDERSDAFVVLPGGIGTLEELVEIMTLKQLGYHERPIVVIDADGYWDPLIVQLRRMVDQSLAAPELLDLWQIASTVEEAVEALRSGSRAAAVHTVADEFESAPAPPRE